MSFNLFNPFNSFNPFNQMKQTRTSAFTLVELLVVIAVIGILAGLMVPLVQGMHKRALLSDAKELCIQVADAWAMLPIDYGRFPFKDVIEEQARKSPCGWSKTHEGDLVFAMNPAVGNLLNFWKPRSPVPETDKKIFPKNLAAAKVGWNGGDPPSVEEVENWAADTRFERSVSQKRFGVFPMGSRSEDDGDDTATSAPASDACLVVVMLDTDGDGVVHPDKAWLPGDSSAGSSEDTPEVRRRAVAWCQVSRADNQIVYSWK